MQRSHRMVAGTLAAAMLLSGCYGPFELTKKVWKWNGEVSDNKWVVEAVFLVAAVLPVYYVAGAADVIIFNTVEFWTGENPLAKTSKRSGLSATKRIVRGDQEIVLKRMASDAGDALVSRKLIQQPGQDRRIAGTVVGHFHGPDSSLAASIPRCTLRHGRR